MHSETACLINLFLAMFFVLVNWRFILGNQGCSKGRGGLLRRAFDAQGIDGIAAYSAGAMC